MSHRYHPNPKEGDEREAVLWDDCQDCGAHARNLGLTLDENNWQIMWDRMIEVEVVRNPTSVDARYLSNAEALLGKQMYQMYIALDRYTAIDPIALFAPWRLV